ncbi:MAG: hypothetical protein RLZZ528_196 [Pseudomonadota bacterium]
MSTWSTNALPVKRSWLGRAEDWLDDRGKGAWIAAMVLSFILFWPVGLALLAYMIWSKRMFSKSCAMSHRHHHHEMHGHMRRGFGPMGFRSSGNTAFDAYKADTLDRLQREQDEFESFLARLRASKDKSEFDAYMDERAAAARDAGPAPAAEGTDSQPDNNPSGRY